MYVRPEVFGSFFSQAAFLNVNIAWFFGHKWVNNFLFPFSIFYLAILYLPLGTVSYVSGNPYITGTSEKNPHE